MRRLWPRAASAPPATGSGSPPCAASTRSSWGSRIDGERDSAAESTCPRWRRRTSTHRQSGSSCRSAITSFRGTSGFLSWGGFVDMDWWETETPATKEAWRYASHVATEEDLAATTAATTSARTPHPDGGLARGASAMTPRMPTRRTAQALRSIGVALPKSPSSPTRSRSRNATASSSRRSPTEHPRRSSIVRSR